MICLDRMTIEDFCSKYSDLDICSLYTDFLDGNASCHWGCSIHDGRWLAGTTAGGCLNYRGVYDNNIPLKKISIFAIYVLPKILTQSTFKTKIQPKYAMVRKILHWLTFYLLDSFWTNPQYRLKIEGLDEDCAETQGDKNMLVSLMQKPDKRNRRLAKSRHIGFSIFEVCVLLLFSHMMVAVSLL